jgi:hypothetical protein
MCFPYSYVEISYDAREFSYFLALRGPLFVKWNGSKFAQPCNYTVKSTENNAF